MLRQPGPLDLPPGTPNKRRGLIWLSALARAEVAAMLVGFAEQGGAFVDLAQKHDFPAYREIVRDAMLTHYWSLKNDGTLAAVVARGNSTQVLAFLRRLIVAHALVGASAELHKGAFDAAHQQQLAQWSAELQQTLRLLTQRLRAFLQPEANS
jgi:hypothetical protein